jgi:Flp pilus assembly protein TadD
MLYLPTLGYDYTLMDDYGLIVENEGFLTNPSSILGAFALDPYGAPGAMYRPGLTLSLMLDRAWSGRSPWGYHLTNVLIHSGCCLLLFLLLSLLGGSPPLAWALSAWFAVHPALVPAVAWIPGRNDTLMAMWLIASLIAWLKYSARPGGIWLAVHWIAGGLALFTKETALFFPILGAALAGGSPRRLDCRRGLAIPARGGAGLIAGWAVLRNLAASGESGIQLIGAKDLIQGLAGYIGKIALPIRLGAIPLPDEIGLWIGVATVGLTAVLIVSVGLRSRILFGYGLAWLLLGLAPNAFTSTDYPNFLEHRLYLPMVGVAIMALGIRPLPVVARHRRIAGPLLAVFLAGLAAISLARSWRYRDRHRFWEYAVETSPSLYYAHDMLGKVRLQDGDLEGARSSFEQALSLNPAYHHGYNNLAVALGLLGEADLASSALEKALVIRPDDVQTIMNLGALKRQMGDLSGAIGLYHRALALDPLNHQAWNDLGTIWYTLGQPDSALSCFEKALVLSPGDPSYQSNYRAVKNRLSR